MSGFLPEALALGIDVVQPFHTDRRFCQTQSGGTTVRNQDFGCARLRIGP